MIQCCLPLVLAFVLTTLAALAPAQQPGKVPVIGVLMVSAGPDDPVVEAFRKGLRERGYVEGRNIRIEHRSAQGQIDQLPHLAEELVRLRADIIVSAAEPALRAVKQATRTIPVVMILHDYDPVALGLIDSFSSPGGNFTGISSLQFELIGKRLELLKETLRGLSRVAVLFDEFSRGQLEQIASPARALGIALKFVELRAPRDYRQAFATARQAKAGAAMVLFSPVFYVDRERIVAEALRYRLPTMFQDHHYVEAGGLMSYGPSVPETFERAAYFAERLLKGAKPRDLPVEQPLRFVLKINSKTAKAIGVTWPESILIRADEVIE